MKSALAPPPLGPSDAETWMNEALREAREAFARDEVPVGCVVLNRDGQIVGRAGDDRQQQADPFAHAEALAIRQAAAAQGDWRLDGHTLVVTLEPCPMCAGLILMARVGRIIYGAASEKWGAASSRIDLLTGGHFPHKPEVIAGILATPCAEILSLYFSRRRAK